MSATILVVDDDAGTRTLLEELLRPQGYSVVTATDGRQALDTFARVQPDLVLLDVLMPQPDGFEVCAQLKDNPDTRLTPVVLVTGLSDTQDRVRGLEAGADDFLNKPVDRSELLARVRSLVNLKDYTDELERAEAVLFALANSIEAKDPYTQGHCQRLADYSVQLGEQLQLGEEQITALRRAGFVHDVGKVAVPDAILLHQGELTPEQWTVIREHPIVGERICAPLRSFQPVLPIIRHHHEKFDGSGYPDGLRGEEIPLTARILQLADIYDALVTDRPYKTALSATAAMRIMTEEVEKGWWDPHLFARFREMIVSGNGRHSS